MKTIKTSFDSGALLIGLLEIIKRKDTKRYSLLASKYLQEYFSFYNKPTWYMSEIPIDFLIKIDRFFIDYFENYKEEGCVTSYNMMKSIYEIYVNEYDEEKDNETINWYHDIFKKNAD